MTKYQCKGLNLLDLTLRHCRWPINGEGADTVFCAAPNLLKSYCSTHTLAAIGRGTGQERSAHRALKQVMAA